MTDLLDRARALQAGVRSRVEDDFATLTHTYVMEGYGLRLLEIVERWHTWTTTGESPPQLTADTDALLRELEARLEEGT